MKIAFVLPDGVGVRNYLYARLLPLLQENHEVVVISTLVDNDAVQDICNEIGREVSFFPLPEYSERVAVKFFERSGPTRDCLGIQRANRIQH